MERAWVFDRLAVMVRRVDFLDPAEAHRPDARERGVRVEVRPSRTRVSGSIYASDAVDLEQALCRLDFLESGPGLADRMHWHPDMTGGEPGDRTYDVAMPEDPRRWLVDFLRGGLAEHLGERADDHRDDLAAIGDTAEELGRALDEGLAWARGPWPEATHDARGMAAGS